jgi:hypothetical protein
LKGEIYTLDELKTTIDGVPCCYLTGRTDWIEIHHCFQGANRKLSEKYGLCVYLNHYAHNEPPDGVHFNKQKMRELQAEVQYVAMKHYGWTTEDFIKIFGRNYL